MILGRSDIYTFSNIVDQMLYLNLSVMAMEIALPVSYELMGSVNAAYENFIVPAHGRPQAFVYMAHGACWHSITFWGENKLFKV